MGSNNVKERERERERERSGTLAPFLYSETHYFVELEVTFHKTISTCMPLFSLSDFILRGSEVTVKFLFNVQIVTTDSGEGLLYPRMFLRTVNFLSAEKVSPSSDSYVPVCIYTAVKSSKKKNHLQILK